MPDYSHLSDDELLARTAREPDAFGAFYRRHVQSVLRFAVVELRDTERALDLTAETFAIALAKSARFRPGGPPARAWLIGIVRNEIAMTRRRAGSEAAARRRLGMPVRSFSDEALERAEELLDADQRTLLAGMDGLPPAEREAVRARVLGERDYAEIAEASGVTEAAIRQRVRRGLSKLARLREGEERT